MQNATATQASAVMPALIYGTAWKKDDTQHCVEQAYSKGFRGFDTACQPRHYFEPGLGKALNRLMDEGVSRETIYLQTKFTPVNGQDLTNIPYDPETDLTTQIRTSCDCSLKNLHVSYLDAYILHSPIQPFEALMEAWAVFETLYQERKVLRLGISNCYDPKILERLYRQAVIKPEIVQNRFYATTGFDKRIRAFCIDNGMRYQSFWTLTANPQLLESTAMFYLTRRYKKTPAQILFRYLQHKQITPLTGTRDPLHMQEDLACSEFDLDNNALSELDGLLC